MPERLVTIGHIVEDVATPENIVGGGVSYGGMTAKKLGADVTILTKIPENHRFLDFFETRGITVVTLPTQNASMTTFENIYDGAGNRSQLIHGRQEDITTFDLETSNYKKDGNDIFLVAPVIGEVETAVIPYLAKLGPVAVTPQGYFRSARQDGVIFQKAWRGFEFDLSSATMTILSEEDITIGGILNGSLLQTIRDVSQITVLTRGHGGATVFDGKRQLDIKALPLKKAEEKDFTGAGDTFAAAFMTRYLKSRDLQDAGVFAAFYAGVKITGIAGRGIDSIPSRQDLEEFLISHKEVVKDFLTSNSSTLKI